MDSSECDKEDAIDVGVIGTVSMDLEIWKFEAFGLKSGSTSGCMPPSTDIVFLSDISPPNCWAQSNKKNLQ